jgi:uncharacterized RDD family membrane protein YckC
MSALEQALASPDGDVEHILDLADAEIELAAADGDEAALHELAATLAATVSERGDEWQGLAVAAARARVLAGPRPITETPPPAAEPAIGAPPAPPVTAPPPVSARSFVHAGSWRRLVAFLINLVIGFVLSFTDAAGAPWGLEVAAIVAYFAFFPAFADGVTPGKAALGIAIRVGDGSKLGFGRSPWRVVATIILWVTVIGFLIDVILIAADARRQGLHDKMANTIVVRTRT